jgi:hypothetical protein
MNWSTLLVLWLWKLLNRSNLGSRVFTELPNLGEVKEILKIARVQAQKQPATVQHPIVCIDVIEEGIISDPRAGLMKVITSWCYIFLVLCHMQRGS